MPKRTSKTHGGARENAGRPPKVDRDRWGQITCVLRNDTIDRLREGANSRFFGQFLQQHLDRFPPPNREQFLLFQTHGRQAARRPRVQYRPLWKDDRTLSYRDYLNIAGADKPEEAYQKYLSAKNDKPRKAAPRRAVAHQKR